ncbi:MAG: hypothetical protein JRG73_19760 [Deltaproteobacteria bacterium]|nr:hypothetical protein [Deltaproteobacteria bacterium]
MEEEPKQSGKIEKQPAQREDQLTTNEMRFAASSMQSASLRKIWLAVGNLNLFGLGYVLSAQYVRWVIFIAVSLILLLVAYFNHASRNPIVWGLVFIAIFIAAAVDLWFLLKKHPAKLPKFLQKFATLLPILSILVNVLFYGSFFLYRWAGETMYQKGLIAYEQSDYYSAFGNWYSLEKYFGLSLNPKVPLVQEPLDEISLIITAQNQSADGEYEAALASIETWFDLFPDSPKTSELESDGLDAYLGWAKVLADQDDYEGGLRKLQEGQARYSDAAQHRESEVRSVLTQQYLAWGQSLAGEGSFETAIQKFETISRNYPQSAKQEQAYEESAQAYLTWGQHLAGEGSFETAIQKFDTISRNYPQSTVQEQAYEESAQAYFDWAEQLGGEGSFGLAVQKLEKMLYLYADSSSVAEAEQKLPELYLNWGKALRGQGRYLRAMEVFDEIENINSPANILASAEQEHENTIPLLAKDTGEDGQQVLEAARVAACNQENPSHPAVGILTEEPGKMLACGRYRTWVPDELKAHSPGTFRYIAIREYDDRVIQTCPYTGGHILYRMQKYWNIKILRIDTLELVAERTFYGSLPDSCPATRQFFSAPPISEDIDGDPPDMETIANWLEGVIQ